MDRTLTTAEITFIKEVPIGHQFESYVRIKTSDVSYWVDKQQKKVFRLKGDKLIRVMSANGINKHFVLWE